MTLDDDADGMLDLVFVNNREPAALLLNRSKALGKSIRFRLVGREANRNAIGSQVRLLVNDQNHQYVRWVAGGGSYLSTSSLTVHFGVPSHTDVTGVEVTWPGGKQSRWEMAQLQHTQTDTSVIPLVEPALSTD